MTEFFPGDIVECTFDYPLCPEGTQGRVESTGICNNGDQFIRMTGLDRYVNPDQGYRSMNFKLVTRPAMNTKNWKQFILAPVHQSDNGTITRPMMIQFKCDEKKVKGIVEDYVRAESAGDPTFRKAVVYKAIEEFEIAPPPVNSRKVS